jgi:hypothetical protein
MPLYPRAQASVHLRSAVIQSINSVRVCFYKRVYIPHPHNPHSYAPVQAWQLRPEIME